MDAITLTNPRICDMFHESVPYVYGLLKDAEDGKIISAKTIEKVLALPLQYFVPKYTMHGVSADPAAVHDSAMFLGVLTQYRCKTYAMAAYAGADMESFAISNIVAGIRPLVAALEKARPTSAINFNKACELVTTEYLSMVQLLVAPTMVIWLRDKDAKPETYRTVLDYMYVFAAALFGTLIRGGAKYCRIATDVPAEFWEPSNQMEAAMNHLAEVYTERVSMFMQNCGHA